jgi:uncharacterized phiE125 gp8 family phage protein
VGLSVVTAPTFDPLSLLEAKDHARISSTDEDGLLAGYIFAAREWVESQTHLKLCTQTLDLTVDDGWPIVIARGMCRTRIEFPVKPVASVTQVTYVDANGGLQTLASNQYTLRNDGAVHYIEPVYNVTWPTVRCQTAAITVRFVAGWPLSDVPNPIIQALRLLFAHADRNREAVSNGTFTEVPLGVEAMISPYRFTRFQ